MYRKRLKRKKDKRYFENTANRVHSGTIQIGQRGGRRI